MILASHYPYSFYFLILYHLTCNPKDMKKSSGTKTQINTYSAHNSRDVLQYFPSARYSSMMTSSKGKFVPRYWPFVRGIHRSPVNYPQKGQWLGALIFSLICAWISDWVNNGESGDLRRYRVIVMHYMVLYNGAIIVVLTMLTSAANIHIYM